MVWLRWRPGPREPPGVLTPEWGEEAGALDELATVRAGFAERAGNRCGELNVQSPVRHWRQGLWSAEGFCAEDSGCFRGQHHIPGLDSITLSRADGLSIVSLSWPGFVLLVRCRMKAAHEHAILSRPRQLPAPACAKGFARIALLAIVRAGGGNGHWAHCPRPANVPAIRAAGWSGSRRCRRSGVPSTCVLTSFPVSQEGCICHRH